MSGGCTRTNRCGSVRFEGNGTARMQGGAEGHVAPFDKGMKMFELVQFNVFPPDVKKGGAGCWQAMGLGGMPSVGRTCEWSPTWFEMMRVGSFDPSAANCRAYVGMVHSIASSPQPKRNTFSNLVAR